MRNAEGFLCVFSLHRLSGEHELPQAGSSLTGRLFFCTG